MSLRELVAAVVAVWAGTSPFEAAAAVLAIAYVVLMIGQQRAAWIVGGISTAMYLYIFAVASLYMQAILQAYYVIISVYGWWAWRGADAGPPLAVTQAGWRVQAGGLLAVTSLSAATATWLAHETHSTDPYLDSLTTWASVFATWLATRKKIDNWVWWLAIDALIVVLGWKQKLYVAMIPYAAYVGLAVIGWRSWNADMKKSMTERAVGASA